MSDEQTPPEPDESMDDLIAAAAAQAEAEEAAETEPEPDPEDDLRDTVVDTDSEPEVGERAEGEFSEAMEAPSGPTEPDWEALAELDDRTRGELLAELTAASVARDEFFDRLQRKQAEFDNFRKRMQRDAAAVRVNGHAELATRLLDVLDDFDRTLANAGDVDETFLKGVTLVHDKLLETLGGFRVTRIDEVDVDFDPNRHEAVQRIDADEPLDEPQVAEVYRPGYELDGRILRAAMVVVRQ